MNMVPLTVAVPVGPHPHNRRWLDECIESVLAQDPLPRELLVIDDGGGDLADRLQAVPCNVVTIPWPSGVAHTYNYCVAAALHDLCIVLNSDDKLLPGAVGAAWAAWEREPDGLGYYWFDVQYSDGTEQHAADGCAMATRGLWKLTGGIPQEGAIGGGDWLWMSLLHTRGLARHLHRIASTPYYWYRQHPETDTNRNRRTGRHMIAQQVLEILTREVRA